MTSHPTLTLPSTDELLGVSETQLSDEQDIAYNAHCTAVIVDRLLELRAAGAEPPLLRTFYPHDDESTADLVSLDRDGCVVVITPGSR